MKRMKMLITFTACISAAVVLVSGCCADAQTCDTQTSNEAGIASGYVGVVCDGYRRRYRGRRDGF